MKVRILSLLMALSALCSPLMATDTLVTPPADASVTTYHMVAFSYRTDSNPAYDIRIATSGNEVYVQGLFQYLPEAWVKGTKEGSKLSFPSGQYLGTVDVSKLPELAEEDRIEHTSNEVYMYCSSDRKTIQPFEMEFTADGSTFEAYYQYLFFSEKGDMNTCFEHLQNLTGFTGEKHVVTPPEGLQLHTYRLDGLNSDKGAPIHYNVSVGIDGSDVYIKGVCEAFHDAWIKGTMNIRGEVTFPRNQHLGYMANYRKDIWFTSVNADEAFFTPYKMQYDLTTESFSSPENLWMVFNGDPAALHYYMILRDVVLTPVAEVEGVDIYKKYEMPAGAPVVNYVVSGTDRTFSSPEPIKPYTVEYAQVGREVYVKGLFQEIPTGVMHGTLSADGSTLTFDTPQFLGSWYDQFDTWAKGINFSNRDDMPLIFAWDANTDTYTLSEDCIIVFDTEALELSSMPLQYLQNVVLTCTQAGIHSVEAAKKNGVACDLQGRRLNKRGAQGLYIVDGRKTLRPFSK